MLGRYQPGNRKLRYHFLPERIRYPQVATATILVAMSAVIVLRKNATVKVLDMVVPVMAGAYFLVTLFVIIKNITLLPSVIGNIFSQAFGIRQFGGGLGVIVMNGVKRGLFSNEAGSGSAPCAAAAAEVSHPVKQGLIQARCFIDTLVICSCSAFLMLLAPAERSKVLWEWTFTGSYEPSPWICRRCIYRSCTLPVQLFHFPWHSLLCPLQRILRIRRYLESSDRIQDLY